MTAEVEQVWQLIFVGPEATSPQQFTVVGDPQAEAIRLLKENEWLSEHKLVCAIRGAPGEIRLMDDARTGECGLL